MRVFESTTYKTSDFPTFLFFRNFPLLLSKAKGDGSGAAERLWPHRRQSKNRPAVSWGLVFCRILQIFFLQLCLGLYRTSLGVTQNYPEGCTVLHFFVIRTLYSFTRKRNYQTCSDKLQKGACYSQGQWFDVSKPQNSPLFGVIDQKKWWQESTETKSEVLLLRVPIK